LAAASNGQKLDDVVKEAERYYNYVRTKEVSGTRLDVLVVSVVMWFSAFIVLALISLAVGGCLSFSAFTSCVSNSTPGIVLFRYLELPVIGSFVVAAGAGTVTYLVRRKRRSELGELGAVIGRMKEESVTSEDGLRLVDAMHQASLVLKKRRFDSAVEYGVGGFIIAAILGGGVASILVGVLAYFYFKEKALREYESEDRRYEDSKKELLQSL
jgi:hypothetical protein